MVLSWYQGCREFLCLATPHLSIHVARKMVNRKVIPGEAKVKTKTARPMALLAHSRPDCPQMKQQSKFPSRSINSPLSLLGPVLILRLAFAKHANHKNTSKHCHATPNLEFWNSLLQRDPKPIDPLRPPSYVEYSNLDNFCMMWFSYVWQI